MPAKKKAPTKKKPAKKKPALSKTTPKKKAAPKKKAQPKTRLRHKEVTENTPLTDKQALFVRWYVSDICNCNGRDAARRAGYRGNDITLSTIAHENINKPHVRKAINDALAKASKDADITVESTLRKLTELRERAIEAGQLGAAVRATELQGKYQKMFTDKIEHTQTLDEMSMDDLTRMLNQLTQENGIDIRELIKTDGTGDGDMLHPPGDEAED